MASRVATSEAEAQPPTDVPLEATDSSPPSAAAAVVTTNPTPAEAASAVKNQKSDKPRNLESRKFIGPPTKTVQPHHPSAADVRVISYNILADGTHYALSFQHSYCARDAIVSKSRYPRIIQELLHYDAAVIALQEVQIPFMKHHLAKAFPKDKWFYLYNPRCTLDEEANPHVQRAVLDRTGDLLLVRLSDFDIRAHSLSQYAKQAKEGHCMGWLAASTDASLQLFFERGDGVCLALIQHRLTGRCLCVANTHLTYHPTHPHVKTLQAVACTQAIHAFLARMQAKWPSDKRVQDASLVVAGDMNAFSRKSTPDRFDLDKNKGAPSGVFEVFTRCTLSASHQDHPSRRAPGCGAPASPLASPLPPLQCAYTAVLGREPPMTTKTSTFAGNIDQIYVSRDVAVSRVLDLPYDYRTADGDKTIKQIKFRPIPGKVWPSDHLALGCELSLSVNRSAPL